MNASSSANSRIAVWDPFVRIAHWLLVLAFLVAYLTEDELLPVHVWAGYTVGVIVVARVLWGFVGSRHARFADFLFRPATIVSYFFNLLRGRGKRYIGHSPAGGAMVILLLLGLAAIAWSGMMVYAYDQQAGPLAQFVLPTAASSPDGGVGSAAFAAREDFWEETHEICVNLTLLLVILHVGGVLLASFVHKENLARAMVTGKKRSHAENSEADV